MIEKMHKYYINQDYQMRVSKTWGNDNKISRYYSFYNYVYSVELTYSEITLKAILEECEREKVDYLIYYYWQGFPSLDFYDQFRFEEFSIFRALLEGGK